MNPINPASSAGARSQHVHPQLVQVPRVQHQLQHNPQTIHVPQQYSSMQSSQSAGPVQHKASQPIRGKTSPYGFFVKMCYEEHKRKFPQENVLVTEISKKCSEKWKVNIATVFIISDESSV